jgi:hypothetical protein
VYKPREGPIPLEPPTASGATPVVMDLDSPRGESLARDKAPSQRETNVQINLHL